LAVVVVTVAGVVASGVIDGEIEVDAKSPFSIEKIITHKKIRNFFILSH
jgi:hypothetical protein